jgi:hypothetical protein
VPAGAIEHHHGVFVRGERLGKAIQEQLHRRGADRRQDEGEGTLAIRAGGGEQIRPFVALILRPWRALATQPPAMTQPA